MKRILVGSAGVAAGNVAGAGLLALFMLLAAQRLPIADFGVLASLYAGALLASDLTDFGTGLRLVIRSGALSHNAVDARVRALLRSRVVLHLVMLGAVVIVGIVSGTLPIWLSAWGLSLATALRVLLQARERARQMYFASALLIICERSVGLVAMLLIPASVAGALTALALGSLSVSLVVMAKLDRSRRRASSLWQYRAALPVGISSTSSSLSQLEVPLVAALSGAASAGEYAVAARLLSPVTFLPAALSSVLARELPALRRDRLNRTVLLMLILSVGGVATLSTLIVIAAPTIAAVLGPDYAASVLPIQIFAATSVIVAGRQTFQIALQATGNMNFVAAVTLWGTVGYLCLLAAGSSILGAVGATMGAFLGQSILLLVLVVRWLRRDSSQHMRSRRV